MGEALPRYLSLLAFAVSLGLSAWCLGRVRKSAPTLLHLLILCSFALWTGFEYLWFVHRLPAYEHLSFTAVTLAVCFGFHYSASLSPPGRLLRAGVTGAYSGASFFLLTNLGGFVSRPLGELFWTAGYNLAFLAYMIPVGAATLYLLVHGRRGATERNLRSLYTYPLWAGLVALPLGATELARPLGLDVPRLGSLGALVAAVILTLGVLRHRRVYDAIAVLKRDTAALMRATVQGILVVEPDGRIVFANSVAKSLVGGSPRTLAEAGLDLPPFGRSLVRRGDRILEIRAVRSGEVFPAGRVSLILQDKTADLELVRDLASKEALVSLGTAAATLLHEVRNPLTAVKAALDCITHDLAAGHEPDQANVDIVHDEVRRLGDLLERSLELSRPLDVRRESCDVNDLLQKSLRRVPPPPGVEIKSDLAADLPRVDADPELLVQLFVNLLRNAVEASPQVRIRTGREEGDVAVRVTSAGARIPDEVMPRLFEPFVTTKPRGTGLGLAFSRKIATAHRARLEGRNTQAGVDFEVRLPT